MVVVTLGQQHNVGEKLTVILYTYINRHAGTPEKHQKQQHSSTSSKMVVIRYCYIIGCKDKATTWYLNGNGYFPHRWGILLFTPPPGSRSRRLGWSQYMHECVGASQGYHGVVGGLGLGLGLGLAVGWLVGSWRWGKYGFCPTGVGIPLYPWQHLDGTVWAAR